MTEGTAGPRLFLSAGDLSGDQHAARLLTRLSELLPGLSAEGLGGPALAAAGLRSHADLVSQAILGLGPALAAVPSMLALLRRVGGILDARRPQAVVLVDYPGLNLFVARLAHRRRIPVVYFVAPQLWAWAPWRVRRFARVVDEALVIFPFEQAFFRQAGLEAHWIGHPSLDGLPRDAARAELVERPRPVALLPGSRPREVGQHMPLLLEVAARLASRFPDASFHTAHVGTEQRARLVTLAAEAGVELHVHGGDVHGVMASCRCALVASGTATLETALLGTPLVAFYRLSGMEAALRPWLLVPEWVSQVNLLAGRPIVPEVLLSDDDVSPLVEAALPLLEPGPAWQAQRRELARLEGLARGPGAIERAAQRLAERLRGPARAQAPGSQR